MDNIKFNKIPPSLSPARKVVRTDSRGRHNPGRPFKESLERKRKKKEKDNTAEAKQPESEHSIRIVPPERPAGIKISDRCRQAGKSARSRLIDIRV